MGRKASCAPRRHPSSRGVVPASWDPTIGVDFEPSFGASTKSRSDIDPLKDRNPKAAVLGARHGMLIVVHRFGVIGERPGEGAGEYLIDGGSRRFSSASS